MPNAPCRAARRHAGATLVGLLAAAAFASSAYALNPQPLPPGGMAALINPGGPVELNPQPLPPGAMQLLGDPAGPVELNPQPLPPGASLSIDLSAPGFADPGSPLSNPIGIGTPGGPEPIDSLLGPGTFIGLQPGQTVSLNPQPLPPGGIVSVRLPGNPGSPPGFVASPFPSDWVTLNPQPLPPGALVGVLAPPGPGSTVALNPQPLPPGAIVTFIKVGDWIDLRSDPAGPGLQPDSLMVFSQVAAVPEPATTALWAFGAVGLASFAAWRRRLGKRDRL